MESLVEASPQILDVRAFHKTPESTKLMMCTSTTFGMWFRPDPLMMLLSFLYLGTSGSNQVIQWLANLTDNMIDSISLLTFLLLSSSACVRTDSSFSRAASVLCRTPSFSSSFCTTNSWASTWRATTTVNTSVPRYKQSNHRYVLQVRRHLCFECENLVGQLLLLLFQQLVDLVGFDSLTHQLEIGVVLLS